mgnify:CR=1 FL=1
MFTPKTVILPPSPMGPMPVWFAASRSSFSSLAISGSGLGWLRGRSSAFFASFMAMSDPPPIATPRMFGGHGFAPALIIVSITNFLSPLIPSPGTSMPIVQTFSEPPPLGSTVISRVLPGTISQFMNGMFLPVLSPVFFCLKGSTAFGLKGIWVVAFLVALRKAFSILSRFLVWEPAFM